MYEFEILILATNEHKIIFARSWKEALKKAGINDQAICLSRESMN